ncbi:hypothetical protein PR202_gb06082 [Eleusine coracana subsp. coracana]|uniref:START domain-containing protein n=1 Tax=Eleusine coracana subsp. coracana TaxID=191504 RepID=A0AAV5E7Y4_ELECO|nr:hypothetical protein PR202_gb06082 [Eleusine coracana subsp. coracana]
MGYVLSAVARVLEQQTAWGVAWEMVLLAGPLWAAALIGLLLGWAWRPRWAAGLVATADGRHPAPFAPFASVEFWKVQLPARLRAPLSYATAMATQEKQYEAAVQGSSEMANEELAVGKDDLVNLWRLVEGRDGGPAWIKMMEKELPTFTYQAWRRDAQNGPPQYQSSTIFENATPEEVRDFFGDDEFRMSNKWDDMLIYHKTLEECHTTGTMKVHWVRKFPFFCSDREYIIARRIWKLGGAYYCVTKDMGIPYEIAKLGIRQGMWGCVKRIEPGLRAYQKVRAAGEPLSPSAMMAQINTKVGDNFVRSLESNSGETEIMEGEEKPARNHVARYLVLGGAVALACTLDQGLLTKALIFGVARKFVGQRKPL